VTSTVSASQSNKFEMLGSARARVGYLVTPNILLYGTGGLGWTRQIGANTVTQTSGVAAGLTLSTTSTLSGTSSLFGWVAGVGGEAKIFDSNWLFRVEYLHYDFGDLNSSTITTGSVTGAAFTPITNGSTKLTVDVVRAGISYKFGGGAVVARY
jgi:opacity protein-like surface antigen